MCCTFHWDASRRTIIGIGDHDRAAGARESRTSLILGSLDPPISLGEVPADPLLDTIVVGRVVEARHAGAIDRPAGRRGRGPDLRPGEALFLIRTQRQRIEVLGKQRCGVGQRRRHNACRQKCQANRGANHRGVFISPRGNGQCVPRSCRAGRRVVSGFRAAPAVETVELPREPWLATPTSPVRARPNRWPPHPTRHTRRGTS